MRKIIYSKWLDVIADYYSGDYPDKDKALKMAVANAVAAIPWKDRSAILKDYMVHRGGIESVNDGCYGISYYDAYNDMKTVYGDSFNDSVYVNNGGDWRLKNDKPYVWMVYCNQIARALAIYFKNEYADKGKQLTVGDIDD